MLGVGGCSEEVLMGAKDSAGMTLGEVEAMSMEQQFDLAGTRYDRVQELITDMQTAVYGGEWDWINSGLGINSGDTATDSLKGSTVQNAYYYRIIRAFSPPGATGAQSELEPAAKYFKSKGWKTEEYVPEDVEGEGGGNDYELVAVTDDAYYVRYTAFALGHHTVEVWSGVWWCDDYSKLTDEVIYRIPKEKFLPPEEARSTPGDFIKFPKWSDPKVWSAEL